MVIFVYLYFIYTEIMYNILKLHNLKNFVYQIFFLFNFFGVIFVNFYFVDGQLFSGTVADASQRDPLILKIDKGHMVRTVQHDSKVVNGKWNRYNCPQTSSFLQRVTNNICI